MSDYPKDGEPVFILWEWVHHSLEGEPCDSLEEAATIADARSDAGESFFECIEVIAPDGTTEIHEEWRPFLPPTRPPAQGPKQVAQVARVMIAPPRRLAGEPGARAFWWSSHETWDEANAEAARWGARLGDRVKVEATP